MLGTTEGVHRGFLRACEAGARVSPYRESGFEALDNGRKVVDE